MNNRSQGNDRRWRWQSKEKVGERTGYKELSAGMTGKKRALASLRQSTVR